ncbi:hypothetical protein D0T12_26970 [Actinomadura spongiicola]|uniref:Deoxyribonuclease NucA/NucB domain-containing protein n=1 Tax=Actinomadura spongiicola TaxID=2303421 RepID=A0A372GAP4_9ACTN|nr:NucA/NucB deoxyribonuclease domain-containing protein [Actinomadura spongiicola]RFS82444.1 hypothetical protein D0T12_26970 [Actinomadura spongiicola]
MPSPAPRAGETPRPGIKAIQPLPSWCYEHYNDGKWWFTRTQACRIVRLKIDLVYRDTSGVTVRGGMTVNQFSYLYTSASLTNYQFQMQMGVLDAWGEAASGAKLSANASCSPFTLCKVIHHDFPDQPLRAGTTVGGHIGLDTSDRIRQGGYGTKLTHNTSLFWAVEKPGVASGTGIEGRIFLRCDDALPADNNTSPGCVVREYTPTLYYPMAGPLPEVARHIADAVNAGAPNALERLTDKTLKDKNRAVSCPPSQPRPPGKSCDEYPFASTWQGAATGTNPTSARMIDATQNELGGSALNTFYRENRVLEKDWFHVRTP